MPCAHCDSEPSVYLIDGLYKVRCENPDCPMQPGTLHYESEEMAVAIWNMRETAAAGDVEALMGVKVLMEDKFGLYVSLALYDSMVDDLHATYLGTTSPVEIAERKKQLLNFLHGAGRHESEDDETAKEERTSRCDENASECEDWICAVLTPEEYRGFSERKESLFNFLYETLEDESEDDEAAEDISTPEKNEEPDMVDHPSHYDKNGVECKDWIRTMLTPEEYRGYLKGNVLKYVWRHEDKGKPVQDLEKARKYIDFLIEERQMRR